MKRFILLAFGFLALAFFELSGGSDFDPAETRQASLDMRKNLEAERRNSAELRLASLPAVTGRAPLPAAPARQEAEPDGTELDLASFRSVAAPESGSLPTIAPEPVQNPVLSPEEDEEEPPATASLNAPAVIGLTATRGLNQDVSGISFAGLSASESSTNVGLPDNIRIVSGSRVNLRAGPGTDFDVVDQLNENTRVEILEDSGNGWVQLRPVGGGPTGWIADFLLADG